MLDQRDNSIYQLEEGTRVFYNDDEEIRFRKGVWNYIEAIIRLHDEGKTSKAFFALVADALGQTGEADVRNIATQVGANDEDLSTYCATLNSIRDQGFLCAAKDKKVERVLNALIGGKILDIDGLVHEVRPVLFVTDNEYAGRAAQTIAKEIQLPLDLMDERTVSDIGQMDLTTKTEAIAYLKNCQKCDNVLSSYSCIVGSLTAPNVSFLRNLNRILIRLEKPLILGLLDGPFVTFLSIMANQTGCFECFEQRMLARLEDTNVYHRFVTSVRGSGAPTQDTGATVFTPSVHILTSAVIAEGFLYATLSMLRLAGRVVNIYLPMLEIQTQDLLRVPYCPACGFISKAQMNEMYTSSRRIVDEMLSRVKLEKQSTNEGTV